MDEGRKHVTIEILHRKTGIKNSKENTNKNDPDINGSWTFSESTDIFEEAHAALMLTEWSEYKNIDWELAAKKMISPAWIFDSRSIVNTEKVRDAGLRLWRLGDGLGDK